MNAKTALQIWQYLNGSVCMCDPITRNRAGVKQPEPGKVVRATNCPLCFSALLVLKVNQETGQGHGT